MRIATVGLFIAFPVFLGICVGAVFLQIYLSKREGKLPGLVLPSLAFLLSLLALLNINIASDMSGLQVWMTAISTFLIASIPTIVLIFIYFICREKLERKKQLEKMNVQDLD